MQNIWSAKKNERQHRKPNEVKKTLVATVQVFPKHSPQHLLFNNCENFLHEDEKYQDRYDDQELMWSVCTVNPIRVSA